MGRPAICPSNRATTLRRPASSQQRVEIHGKIFIGRIANRPNRDDGNSAPAATCRQISQTSISTASAKWRQTLLFPRGQNESWSMV